MATTTSTDGGSFTTKLGGQIDWKVGDEVIYPSKNACLLALLQKMDKYPSTRDTSYHPGVNYTADYNSWLNSTGYMYMSLETRSYAKRSDCAAYGQVLRQVRWNTMEGPIEFTTTVISPTIKSATLESCWKFFYQVRQAIPRVQIDSTLESIQENLYEQLCWQTLQFRLNDHQRVLGWPRLMVSQIARTQMDKLTEQGEVTQDSAKAQNTIITMDETQTVVTPGGEVIAVDKYVSTEPMRRFEGLTDRWMPLTPIKITTTAKMGDIIETLYLPEDLYKKGECAPNLTPFQTYIYGKLAIELRIVVNANKFHCGKIIVSSKYGSYQADLQQNGYQSALARNHVIIDLTANNEGVLEVPFHYYRPLVRLVKHDNSTSGVRPSKYCSVYVQILSPLQTGTSGASDVSGRIFYRIKDASFTGMSYRAKVQMLGVENLITPSTGRALREILVGAEKAIDQLGKNDNRDKPIDPNSTIVVPKPLLNFATGKGAVNVVPLRINPYTMTNYRDVDVPLDEPKNYYALARIWGVAYEVPWSANDATDTTLISFSVDPCSRSYTADYIGEPTPLEYAVSNFQFWSGAIELRLDFVSNSFHTGAVQLSAEFGRVTQAESLCESSSTYTKTFHLGEQKSVNFTIPYIYDTVMRRSTANLCNPYNGVTTNDGLKSRSLTIAPESRTYFKVRVINALRPVASAPQAIKILVFMRAGENFCMHGIKGCSMMLTGKQYAYDNFPNVYIPPSVERVKREDKDRTEQEKIDLGRILPANVRNEWNEYKQESLPKVQMDSGCQETRDTTEDFNSGIANLQIQTLDCHMDFSDMLKRPTLLLHKIVVKPNTDELSPYFIPLSPPNASMVAASVSTAPVADFAITLRQSTACNITNLFRYWRGSQRYTIVVWKGTKPIFVSLIPHSGVRILGHMPIVKKTDVDADYSKMPFYGLNFVSEIIVPHINPTSVVEAPYDTENIWTLMSEDVPTRNYTWRDKGDYNSGHLAISVEEEVELSIFWSAGDDFQLSNFFGIPKCRDNGWAYRFADTARVQMDFLPAESRTMVRGLTNTITSKNVARSLMGCIPIVGSGLVAATVANDVSNNVLPRVVGVCDKLETLATTTDSMLNDVHRVITEAVSQIVNGAKGVLSYAKTIYDLVLDILIAWMEKSWRVIGIAIVRFITSIAGLDLCDKFLGLAVALGHEIGEWFTQVTARVQAPTVSSTITGVLLGLVGTVLGVGLDSRRVRSVPVALLERVTSASGMSYLMNVLRYVQGIFEFVRDLVMEALGYVSPEAQALRMLSENNAEVATFVREAQIVTSEACGSMLNNGAFRLRCWKTVMSAYQYQRLLCQVPSNVCNAQLARLCSEVIKIGNEKFADLSCSPVRYEPFVLCVEGEEGVGKSSMIEKMAVDMLCSIGFSCPSSNSIYWRTAGEKFWSGYRDQPVIVYDEFLNSQDPQRCMDMLVELQKLKSTSLFIPEMAHLEEKKIRGNPLIVILLCNGAFPNLSDYARYPRAILRRRDIVLRAELVDEYRGVDLHDVGGEALVDCPHLNFKLYTDAKDEKTLTQSTRSYVDTRDFVVNKFVRWHLREKELVKKRVDRALAHLQSSDVSEIRLLDPFTLFYRLDCHMRSEVTLSQNAYTPYEELETAVTQLLQHIENTPVDQTVEVPPNMTWEDVRNRTQINMPACALIGGFMLTSGAFRYIMRASSSRLAAWSTSVADENAPIRTCSICFETIRVAFVCETTREHANPHVMCSSCYSTSRLHGREACPQCRHPVIVPYITGDQMRVLSLWGRLVVTGMNSVAWFIERVTEYLGLVNSAPTVATLTTYIIGVLATAAGAPQWGMNVMMISVGMTYGSFFTNVSRAFAAIVQVDQWEDARAYYQVDDWDVAPGEEPSSSASLANDAFEPAINEQIVNSLREGKVTNTVCMHHLLMAPLRGVELLDKVWRVPDSVTRMCIDVPIHACANISTCPAKTDQYVTTLEHYLALNRNVIRANVISYFNDPSSARRALVPPMYRPEWMQEIVIEAIPNDWWNWLSEAYRRHKTLILTAVAATGVIGCVIGAYTFSSRVMASVQTSEYDPGASPRHRVATPRIMSERRYFQEGVVTPTPYEVARKYIAGNTFLITIVVDAKKELKMYGVGIFNHYVLIPRHYVIEIKKAMQAGRTVWGHPLNKPQLANKLVLHLQDIVESHEADIAFIKLQPSFPLFKDLRKFIAKEEDYLRSKIPATGCLLAVPARGSDFMTEVCVDIKGIDKSKIILDQDENAFEARDVLVYNYSRPGACGSLLLREHNQRPIIAMHFAGAGELITGEGFGVILSVESLGAIVQMELPTQREEIDVCPVSEMVVCFDDDTRVNYVGSLPKERIPYIPTRGKIVPSSIHGVKGLETIMEPTILHKNDKRYVHDSTPLYEGVKKHGQLTVDFTSAEIEEAKTMLWAGWYQGLKPLISQPKELTLEEAVLGLDVEYYNAMDLNTSAGYPYVLSAKKSKGDYVEVERDSTGKAIRVISISAEVIDEIERKKNLRRQGVVPRTCYVDTLKDEKRKHEKVVSKGGTRVFCNPSMDYVIDCRAKFLHFIAAFMAKRHDLMHAVGVNPTSSEWTKLLNTLLKRNSEFVTIDYSNFGPGYNAGVAKAAYDIMIDWTMANVPGLSRLELECLVYECIQSTHICHNTVYDQVGGSPSGAVFTTVVNSIVNQLYILLAWKTLAGPICMKMGKSPWQMFKEKVVVYVYGDDAIMSVDPEWLELFNGVTINRYFEEHDIVATGADKDDKIQRTTPLSQATFLKRGFARHPIRHGEWLSPLNWESVVSATQWVWVSANIKESTYINCEAALLQAHGHGPKTYKEFLTLVNSALIRAKCPTVLRTWEEIDELFYTEGLTMDILT